MGAHMAPLSMALLLLTRLTTNSAHGVICTLEMLSIIRISTLLGQSIIEYLLQKGILEVSVLTITRVF